MIPNDTPTYTSVKVNKEGHEHHGRAGKVLEHDKETGTALVDLDASTEHDTESAYIAHEDLEILR